MPPWTIAAGPLYKYDNYQRVDNAFDSALAMSDNVTQLRTEIKAWERDFKQQHGHPPSVQDIKDQPAIADKYKLYKRLSKAPAFQAPSGKPSSSDPPSTPPRSQPGPSRGSFIHSKARAVHVAPPSSTANPFSPVKDKGKRKETTRIFERDGERYANPFATPTKSKPTRKPVSPEPFPLIVPVQPKDEHPHDPRNHAVSRARKRLRGEPVSPSPVKEKRPRVGSQTLLPFAKLNQPELASSDEDEEFNHNEADSSFIDDSPVKPSTNGKSFKLLFDETSGIDMKSRAALSRWRTVPNNGLLFPRQKGKGITTSAFDDEDNSMPPPTSQPLPMSHLSKKSRSAAVGKAKGSSLLKPQITLHGFMPAKDNLYSAAQSSERGHDPKDASSSRKAEAQSPTLPGSTKRPLADPEVDSEQVESAAGQDGLSLLPPSPTEKPSKSYKGKETSKSKGMSRKKIKVAYDNAQDDEDDSPEEPEIRVKVSDWSWNRSRSQTIHTDIEDAGLDDPDVRFALRHTRNEEPAADSLLIHVEAGNFDVDLPDHLRSVLSISPTKGRDRKEEGVVRELLYRERTKHYDPSKGGEIWDVGEDDGDTKVSTEGEDDWEGEPVPWEVGEL